MATRRAIIRGGLALSLGVLASRSSLGQPAERAAYTGIETSARTGLSRARLYALDGAPLAAVPLDFRAHGLARHGRKLVVFPRRPGNRFAIVDLRTLEILAVQTAPDTRHFFGHGSFSVDGQHLLVTENDLDTLRGSVGVYDVAATPKRLGHIELPGPGPHEIIRDRSRNRFHVAVGGLETHPDYGRTPLNLHSFSSEVVSLNFDGGALDQTGRLPEAQGVSLRHLALDDRERMYVGGQVVDQGRDQNGQVLWLMSDDHVSPIDFGMRLGGYVSSVDAQGDKAVATSKEAGVAVLLDGDRKLESFKLLGASAAALGPRTFAVSGFSALRLNGSTILADEGHEFDNHGLALQK